MTKNEAFIFFVSEAQRYTDFIKNDMNEPHGVYDNLILQAVSVIVAAFGLALTALEHMENS